MATALEYAQSNGDRFLQQLEALTRIPSVSTDPAFAADVQRAADPKREYRQGYGVVRSSARIGSRHCW